jgi:hypothetical protein
MITSLVDLFKLLSHGKESGQFFHLSPALFAPLQFAFSCLRTFVRVELALESALV